MDTKNDYMLEICKHVVRMNNDIYKKIEKDCKEYLTSPDYRESMGTKKYFYEWLEEYVAELDKVYKDNLISKYGFDKLMFELPKIAYIYQYNSYDEFVEEEGEYAPIYILCHIIESEILQGKYRDLIGAYCDIDYLQDDYSDSEEQEDEEYQEGEEDRSG